LASHLTGFQIDLIKEGAEEEYDMDLAEFREELTVPLYERLVDEGFTTARSVIEANIDALLEIEGLTEDRIRAIKEMMKRELEEAEVDEETDNEYSGESASKKDEDVEPQEVTKEVDSSVEEKNETKANE
jgi:hypothetical protein